MKLWTRYLLKRLFKTFCIFLFILFFTYIIIDLSVQGTHLIIQMNTLQPIFLYYLQTLSKYLSLFFPLTFLLVCLKLLFECTTHHEFTALSMGGLSHKKILSPFFFFAFILSLISLLNYEWVFPNALQSMETFQSKILTKKSKNTPELHRVTLKDGSELVYQQFSHEKQSLFDVFWIQNTNDIWHMKSLFLTTLQGHFVDHFQRSQEGILETKDHFEHIFFPKIEFLENSEKELCPFEERSLSTLMKQSASLKLEKSAVLSHLQYKIGTSLLCPFLLWLIIPVTTYFQRSKPIFIITALSLFGFISFVTILEGMLILGENGVISSFLAIWSPFAICTLVLLIKTSYSPNYGSKVSNK